MSDVINELILRVRERQALTSIVITHDMVTVGRVADRVLMFYPRARLKPTNPKSCSTARRRKPSIPTIHASTNSATARREKGCGRWRWVRHD